METLAPMPRSSHFNQQALGIVLQRLQSLPTALNVMCASKELRATVLGHCVGVLDVYMPEGAVDCSEQQTTRTFATWLRKYGRLAGVLALDPSGARQSCQDLEAELLRGLQEAAAAPAGLHVQELHLTAITTPTAASLFELLPPTKLTGLHIELKDWKRGNDIVIPRINHALGLLTNLQSLSMHCGSSDGDYQSTHLYVSGLSSLTQLTYLSLEHVSCGKVLKHLPDSLVELALTRSFETSKSDCWSLGQLTKVTKLTSDWIVEEPFHAGDVLPPNLIVLSAWDIPHAQVLLPLKKLQSLLLTNMQMPAEDMQQLSSLTALTDVEMSHNDSDCITEAAAGWSALPGLHRLELSSPPRGSRVVLPPSVTSCLGKLSWLTTLFLHNLSVPHEFVAQDLACGLSGLVGLQHLELDTSNTRSLQQQELEPEEEWMQARVSAVLMPAIAGLAGLTRLHVVGLRMTPTAAVALATSTAITSLSFSNCNVGDCVINTLVLRMQQLAKLVVHQSKKQQPRELITDAVLPVLVFRTGLLWSIKGVCHVTQQASDLFLVDTEVN